MTELELLQKLSFLTESKKLGNLEIIDYPKMEFAKIFFNLEGEPWIAEYFYNKGIVHTRVMKNNGYEENTTGEFSNFEQYIKSL